MYCGYNQDCLYSSISATNEGFKLILLWFVLLHRQMCSIKHQEWVGCVVSDLQIELYVLYKRRHLLFAPQNSERSVEKQCTFVQLFPSKLKLVFYCLPSDNIILTIEKMIKKILNFGNLTNHFNSLFYYFLTLLRLLIFPPKNVLQQTTTRCGLP